MENEFINKFRVIKKYRSELQKIGFVIGLALLIYQAIKGFESIQSRDIGFPSFLILGQCLLIIFLSLCVQIFVWITIFHGLGVTLNIPSSASGYVITFVSRYIPGTVWGYFSRAEWLEREEKIPLMISNLCSAVEVIAAALSSVIASGFLLLVKHPSISFMKYFLLSIILFVPVPIWFLFQYISKSKLRNKFPSLLSWINNLSSLDILTWVYCVYLLVVNWLLQGIVIVLVQKAIFPGPIEFNIDIILQNSGSAALSWLIGFVILIIPTGMGVRELSLSELLSSTRGLPIAETTAIAIITRLLMILSEILSVGIALTFRLFQNHKSSIGNHKF